MNGDEPAKNATVIHPARAAARWRMTREVGSGRAPPRLRRATAADAEAVGSLFLASRAASLPAVANHISDAEARQYLAGVVRNPAYAVWAAEQDGLLLGFVALRDGWLDHLYVRPGWYRHGIGRALLDRAKQASPGGLRVFCFQCNDRARAFYASQGLAAVPGSERGEANPDVEYRWVTSQAA